MIALFLRLRRQFTANGWLTVVLLLVAILVLGRCAFDANREAARQRQEANAARLDSRAKETAGGERLNDTLIINTREKELTDAVSSLPDARPSDRRRALACERLRQQGDALPASC